MVTSSNSPTPTADQSVTISARVVDELLVALGTMGVPAEEVLRLANMDPSRLGVPDARLPREDFLTLLSVACELANDPAFGLHWMENLSESGFAILSHLLTHAASIREAIESLLEFAPLFSDVTGLSVEEQGDLAKLRYTSVLPIPPSMAKVQRWAAESVVLGCYMMLRRVRPEIRLRVATFEYGAPPYVDEYRRLLGCEVRFEQEATTLCFDRSLLDARAHQRDEAVYATLRTLAEHRLVLRQRFLSHGARVRHLLLQEAAPHRVLMRDVAKRMGMSERSLHRRLTEEGSAYMDIASDAAGGVATRLLVDEQLMVQEAAFAMGFANASSFTRAFRRWTGKTPTEAQEHRGPRGARPARPAPLAQATE